MPTLKNSTRRKRQHGGPRTGAGRPVGTGKLGGHETKVIRVPVHIEPAVQALIRGAKHPPAEPPPPPRLSPISPLHLPLVNVSVPAGAFDYHGDAAAPDSIDLNAWLAHDLSQAYLCAAIGDSMNRAGIQDGDRLIVDKSISVKSGHIVVGWIAGEGMTVKRFKSQAGQVMLEPDSDNPRHQVYVVQHDELTVLGVVCGIARRLRA